MNFRSFICFTGPLLFSFSGRATDPEMKAASYLSKDSLRAYMSVLTADSLQGRETGKDGQKKAARYLVNSFQRFGLSPVTEDGLQTHPLSSRANKDQNLVVDEQKFVYWNDFFSFTSEKGGSVSCDEGVAVSATFVSSPSFLRKADKQINANTALFLPFIPVSRFTVEDSVRLLQSVKTTLSPLLRLTRTPGAVLLTTDDLPLLLSQLTSIDKGNAAWSGFLAGLPFPVYWVSDAVYEKVFGTAVNPKLKRKKSAIRLPLIQQPGSLLGENVPFVVRGSVYPDEFVAVTAHYDHLGARGDTVFYGADDDASGTSAVMELARVFARAAADGNPPKRTILFMPVSGEEKGLLGSRYYSEHPLVPLEQTVAEVNIDMIGRIDPEHDSLGIKDYVYVIGSDKLSSELHAINESANQEHVGLLLDYRFNVPGEPNRFYFRSDHYNFAKHGIPSIFYFNGKHADYHKPTDTMDKIDFDAMEKRARLVFHTLWELANRPDRIIVDRANDMESPVGSKKKK